MRSYDYVGPAEVLARSVGAPGGAPIRALDDLVAWMKAHLDAADAGWATYVVNLAGVLLVAPRRSEHVACAGAQAVLAAGEVRFDSSGAVLEVTNNSTGYCPAEACWAAVDGALRAAHVPHPSAFTFVARFRRCPECGERNLVKDEWFQCVFCGGSLPTIWNFE